MKSFARFITELFDSSHIIPLRLRKSSSNSLVWWQEKWMVNGNEHRFDATARPITLGSSDPRKNPEDPDEVVGWNFSFTVDGQYSADSEQEAEMKSQTIRIFATALEAIRQLIKEYDPKTIRFSAEKDKKKKNSRIRLYDTMIKRFAAEHGYKLLERSEDQFGQMYVLEKK